jgi:hypothetical protein
MFVDICVVMMDHHYCVVYQHQGSVYDYRGYADGHLLLLSLIITLMAMVMMIMIEKEEEEMWWNHYDYRDVIVAIVPY